MRADLKNDYFPDPGDKWERVAPESAGFDPNALKEAIDFSAANETPWPRDLQNAMKDETSGVGAVASEPAPYNEIIGPVCNRGGVNGIILRGGRVVSEWGDTGRADMTFSASKSYVSTCVGLAYDRKLIPDLHAPVKNLIDDGGFDPPHNHEITWHHLLQQTSEWEGELWGKPDLIDRNRNLDALGANPEKGSHRDLQPSGEYWEYNDVRVNRLALCALRIWRRALPEVLKTHVMDPIGASNNWQWHGYKNSSISIEGKRVQSVSGGGHWGGGLFIGSRDHARFGYLMLRKGRWGEKQILSEDWITRATEPCPKNENYGYMWWLNRTRKRFPSAPSSSFFALGAGSNAVWIDPKHDMVVVVRWLSRDKLDEFWKRVLNALY